MAWALVPLDVAAEALGLPLLEEKERGSVVGTSGYSSQQCRR
jgi:hypothetical protein